MNHYGTKGYEPRPVTKATEPEFKALMQSRQIRPASLDDVQGTHHNRPLYKHPRTGQFFVAIKE